MGWIEDKGIDAAMSFGHGLELALAHTLVQDINELELYAAFFEETLCFFCVVTLLGAENLDVHIFPLLPFYYK